MQYIRVLHVDTEISYGGGQRQLEFLLSKKTYENTTFVHSVLSFEDSIISSIARTKNIELFFFGTKRNSFVQLFTKFYNSVTEFSPDIVHFHTSKALNLAVLFKLFLFKKEIILINTRRVSFNISGFFSKIKYKYACDYHICVSNSVFNQLLSLGVNQEKLKIINSGIIFPKQIKRIDSRKKILELSGFNDTDVIIGSCGNLVSVKRFDWLILAAKTLVEYSPHLKLIIIGDGPLHKELLDIIMSNNLHNHVFLPGHIEKPELLFAGLDIFCMPSKSEGLSGTLMDALVRNVPLLGTDTSGINDIINQDNGFLFKSDSFDDLQKKLLTLSSDKKLRKKLRENFSKDRYSNFDIERTVDKNLGFYKEIFIQD